MTSVSVRAIVLGTDGQTTATVFDADSPPLDWLQEQVGGYIELVPELPQRVIVNEEAVMRGLPINELAAERFGDVLGTVDGKLRGTVVVIEPVQ